MFLTGTKKMLGDRIFLQKAVRIALPVAMQGMLNTIVNLVDTMMIGTLGETTIAAFGLALSLIHIYPSLRLPVRTSLQNQSFPDEGSRKLLHKAHG